MVLRRARRAICSLVSFLPRPRALWRRTHQFYRSAPCFSTHRRGRQSRDTRSQVLELRFQGWTKADRLLCMAEGRVIKGRFGGVGAVEASNAPGASAAPDSASGNPVTPGDVQQQLGLLAHNAQVAATRLIQIPPTGSVP